jgi:hypothetical protein
MWPFSERHTVGATGNGTEVAHDWRVFLHVVLFLAR